MKPIESFFAICVYMALYKLIYWQDPHISSPASNLVITSVELLSYRSISRRQIIFPKGKIATLVLPLGLAFIYNQSEWGW